MKTISKLNKAMEEKITRNSETPFQLTLRKHSYILIKQSLKFQETPIVFKVLIYSMR